MSAWTSPSPTARVRPRRISLPSTATWRSSISSRRGVATASIVLHYRRSGNSDPDVRRPATAGEPSLDGRAGASSSLGRRRALVPLGLTAASGRRSRRASGVAGLPTVAASAGRRSSSCRDRRAAPPTSPGRRRSSPALDGDERERAAVVVDASSSPSSGVAALRPFTVPSPVVNTIVPSSSTTYQIGATCGRPSRTRGRQDAGPRRVGREEPRLARVMRRCHGAGYGRPSR